MKKKKIWLLVSGIVLFVLASLSVLFLALNGKFWDVGGKIAGVVLNRKPVKAKEYSTSYYYGNTSSPKTNSKNSRHGKIDKEEKYTESSISKEKQEEILSQLSNYLNNKD